MAPNPGAARRSTPLATLGSALAGPVGRVGDWVAVEHAGNGRNSRVLPRSPHHKGDTGSETAAQVIAANVDLVFIATSADTDFNLRRMNAC